MSLPTYKRNQLLHELQPWLTSTSWELLTGAKLTGSLISATESAPWARALFLCLMNEMRHNLRARYAQFAGYHQRNQKKPPPCPHHLRNLSQAQRKIIHLMTHDGKDNTLAHIARRIYYSKIKIKTTQELRNEIRILHDYLADNTNPWEVHIDHLIPRDPFAELVTDACTGHGGGGFCDELQFFFTVTWSPDLLRLITAESNDPYRIDINCLEFLAKIIGICAVITRIGLDSQNPIPPHVTTHLPIGIPPAPRLRTKIDNKASLCWAQKGSSKSRRAFPLVRLYCNLLRLSTLGVAPEYIPGKENIVSDKLSRYLQYNSPIPSNFWPQLAQIDRRTTQWDYFQPSDELTSLLHSSLCSPSRPGLPDLPKKLGHFVPAGSTSAFLSEL